MLAEGQFDRCGCKQSLAEIPAEHPPNVLRRLQGKTYRNICCDPTRLACKSLEPEMFDSSYWPVLKDRIAQSECDFFLEPLERKYASQKDQGWAQMISVQKKVENRILGLQDEISDFTEIS